MNRQSSTHQPNPTRYSSAIALVGLLPTCLGVGLGLGSVTIADGQLRLSAPIAPAIAQPRVRWTPPKDRGAAKGTLSGGRRGAELAACGPDAAATRLTLLVPAGSEGLVTTSATPTLAWQITTQQPTSLQLLLSDTRQPMPIYQQTLVARASGIQQVTLPPSIALGDGSNYRWTVIAQCPKGQQSEIYARSFIRKQSGASLGNPTQAGSPVAAVNQAALFAQNGIWYDALGALLNAPQWQRGTVTGEALAGLLAQAVPGGDRIEVVAAP
jgi:hypothetical protein